MQEELENENQWALKERVCQSCGFWKEYFQTEVVPTIKKRRVWNIIDYRAMVNALLKPRSNRPFTTLALQPTQKFEHKRKKENTPPLEIRDKVQEDFVVHKKHFTKHGNQVVKEVLKQEKIFEHTISSEPIIHKKLQHSAIESYLLYLNVQHCNVPLSFKKIQLTIIKCSQSISLIFSVQLKNNPY